MISLLVIIPTIALRFISNSSGLLYTLVRQRGWGYEEGLPSVARFSISISIQHDPKRRVLYVVDCYNNAIRRIYLDQEYRVDTLTGKPYSGYIDGHLNQSLFSEPRFSLLDPRNFDVLLVTDSQNYAIRRIDLVSGTVSTLWKETPPNLKAMAVDDDGNLFISTKYAIYKMGLNSSGNPLKLVESNSGANCRDGDGTKLSFVTADAMIYDPIIDVIIFSDAMCHSIRQLTLNPLSLSTIYGHLGLEGFSDGFGTSAYLNEPRGASLNSDILYIADHKNHAIRNINRTSGQVGTLTGGLGCGYRNGNASIAKLCYPHPLATDSTQSGLVFAFDTYNNAVRMIQNGEVTTIAGQGSPIYKALKNIPTSIASASSIAVVGDNELLLSDAINNCIMRVIINGESLDIKVIAGDGSKGWSDGMGIDSMLNWPTDMALSADKSIVYIADSKNNLIRKFQLKDGRLITFAGTGVQGNDIKPNLLASSFNDPQGMALDTRSDVLYVSDSGNNCIKRINGSVITVWAGSGTAGFKNGASTTAQFARPSGIVYDPVSDCIFVADTLNHALRRIDAKRLVTTIAGINGTDGLVDGSAKIARLKYPTKVVLGRAKGELLILDSGNHAVRVIDAALQNVSTILSDPDANFQGLAIDASGRIYVSDSKSIRIIKKPEDTPKIPAKDASSLIDITIAAIVITMIIVSGSVAFIIYQRFYVKKSALQTTDILRFIERKDSSATKTDMSKTLSTSKTVAIAIPGYLQVELDKTITLPSEVQVSGKGGTAEVIQCKLKDSKLIEKHGIVDVAVKIFGKDTSKESFLYEVMIMSSLPKSPNLIELLGYSDDRVFAIIMKDYPMSLRDLLVDKTFPNNSETNVKVAVDIANGMNLIHQKGIVHFDLKPANVLIEFLNGTVNCVICDFGFANFLSDVQDKIVKGVKKPTAIGITARYAAPELFAKVNMRNLAPSLKTEAPVDIEKKIDVYAYAMTLFYAYLREAPWKDLSVDEIEFLAIAGMRPDITTEQVGDKKIEDLIKACWSHDPNERPSFAEILETLSPG